MIFLLRVIYDGGLCGRYLVEQIEKWQIWEFFIFKFLMWLLMAKKQYCFLSFRSPVHLCGERFHDNSLTSHTGSLSLLARSQTYWPDFLCGLLCITLIFHVHSYATILHVHSYRYATILENPLAPCKDWHPQSQIRLPVNSMWFQSSTFYILVL